MSEEYDLHKLKAMNNGDDITVNWFGESGAHVFMVNWHFIVFYVPQCGEPRFEAAFIDTAPEKVLKLAYSWT